MDQHSNIIPFTSLPSPRGQRDATGLRGPTLSSAWSQELKSPDAHEDRDALTRFRLLQSAFSLREMFVRAPAQAATFLDAYYAAYRKAFPDRDEALSKESILKMVTKPGSAWDVTVICDQGRVIAGYHTTLDSCAGKLYSLGDYLWVADDYKRTKIGTALYHATLRDRQIRGAVGHIGEVNDPRLMSDAQKRIDALSGITAEQRVAFWQKQGRFAVDCPWYQPPLHTDGEEVGYLMLTIQPLGEKPQTLSRETLVDAWRVFYLSFDFDFNVNRTLDRLLTETESFREVPLIGLDEPRSVVKAARLDGEIRQTG